MVVWRREEDEGGGEGRRGEEGERSAINKETANKHHPTCMCARSHPSPSSHPLTWLLLPCQLLDQSIKGPSHHLVFTPVHLVDQNILAICRNGWDGSSHNSPLIKRMSVEGKRMQHTNCQHCSTTCQATGWNTTRSSDRGRSSSRCIHGNQPSLMTLV